ncbi:MAG: nitrogen regulation protein NR(II) [Nitrospiria bacterium]
MSDKSDPIKKLEKERLPSLRRIKWLLAIRVSLVTLLLGFPLLLKLETLKNPWSIVTFYFLIGSIYFLTLLSVVYLKRVKPTFYFVSLQLGMDLLFETALVAVTGGIGSPFLFFYIVTIVLAAIFFHQRGGVIMAAVVTTLFGLMTIFQQTHIPPFETTAGFAGKDVLYLFFLYMSAFFTVGFLSSRLSKRLHEKEVGLSDLRIFHEDIAQSMPSGLITTDLTGIITSFNRSASEITGYALEDVIGKRWWEHFSWRDIQNRYRALAATGFAQRFEGKISNKEGIPRLLGVTISALRNEQGTQIGVIGTFQDLTQIRNLEEAMQKKERLATIGEMAASMAHEIRNPLASLSGSIQVLKSELSLTGENLQLMEIALQDTVRLNSIVTQFLLYARPLPPQRKWVNLRSLLSEMVTLFKNNPAYHRRAHVVLEDIGNDLLVFIDPDQMKQVFWNLANNAFQAISESGCLTISAQWLENRGENGSIQIVFEDTGEGILNETVEKIFDPFFTTKSTGSGLGLAIVQRIIEAHSGEISVESQPRKTSFRIILPNSKVQTALIMEGESDKRGDLSKLEADVPPLAGVEVPPLVEIETS